MTVTGDTRLFALLGDPVSHSMSPAMHNAAFRAAGIDAVYIALRCSRSDAGALVRALARAGGGGNVTIPHKGEAARSLDVASPAVIATDACNTFWYENGRVMGDNTDVDGFVAAANALVGTLHGISALVIGAGGAASAVVHGLGQAGADRIAVANRTHARAEALVARRTVRAARAIRAADIADGAFDLVINATPVGLRVNDALPLNLAQVRRVGAVLDLVCAAGVTPFVAQALELGVPAADGRTMLLHQGAAAFEKWLGVPAPLDVMRDAIGAAGAG